MIEANQPLLGPFLTRRRERYLRDLSRANTSPKKKAKRLKLWSQTKGHCVYCDREISETLRTMDHVWPKKLGGTLRLGNLIPACRECNVRRGNKIPASNFAHEKWRRYVKKKETKLGLARTTP